MPSKKRKNTEKDVAARIEKALLKRAIGYSSKEITKEYQINEGEEVLVRKKVAVKNVPPDISAAKILLEAFDRAADLNSMTDEELEAEKKRLMGLLKNANINTSGETDKENENQ